MLTNYLSVVEAMECFIAFSLMGLVAMMAPKKLSQGGKRARDDETPALEESGDKTNMLNQLKAAKRRLSQKTSVDEEGDEAKSALLDEYCKLSLRDPKKNDILKKWLGDKSCQWWASYAESTTVGTTKSHDTFQGYGTKWLSCICFVFFYFLILLSVSLLVSCRYVVADILKIPASSIDLDSVCSELPHDFDWDMEDPVEKGYAKAGLARFDLAKVKLMVEKVSHNETKNQLLQMSKEGKSLKSSAISLCFNTSSGSGSTPMIKEEIVGWNGFQNLLTLIKSGKGYVVD